MQTLINIDEKLLAEAAQFVTTQNQSQLIEIALLEFIKNHQSTPKRDIRDLVGKVNLALDYDYKKLRTSE
jgi:Arc/MetJ family transcription regulator